MHKLSFYSINILKIEETSQRFDCLGIVTSNDNEYEWFSMKKEMQKVTDQIISFTQSLEMSNYGFPHLNQNEQQHSVFNVIANGTI